MKYYLSFLSLLFIISFASQPQEGYITASKEGYLLKAQHKKPHEIVDALHNYQEGQYKNNSAPSFFENFVFIYGSQKVVDAAIDIIKKDIDLPYPGPGGRFGDNIISKP